MPFEAKANDISKGGYRGGELGELSPPFSWINLIYYKYFYKEIILKNQKSPPEKNPGSATDIRDETLLKY